MVEYCPWFSFGCVHMHVAPLQAAHMAGVITLYSYMCSALGTSLIAQLSYRQWGQVGSTGPYKNTGVLLLHTLSFFCPAWTGCCCCLASMHVDGLVAPPLPAPPAAAVPFVAPMPPVVCGRWATPFLATCCCCRCRCLFGSYGPGLLYLTLQLVPGVEPLANKLPRPSPSSPEPAHSTATAPGLAPAPTQAVVALPLPPCNRSSASLLSCAALSPGPRGPTPTASLAAQGPV